MIVYGSGLGDGNRHNHMDLPILFAGHSNGRFRQGKHVVLPKRTPIANLYVTMLDALSIRADKFADSTARLEI